MAKRPTKRQIATRNVRIYESSIPRLQELAAKTGKNYPRLIDEWLNPEKYVAEKQ